ncbi:MAG: DNA repair protein RecO [Gammaproteobacteria bacterium]|nr:DNA repair protein RecO [Gammaproteobacteria bacterium]
MSAVERTEFEAAFVLHVRSYRESSQIVDLLTQHHGRVGVVARGARRPKSAWRGLLRPFQPIRASWTGRGSLQTLLAAEPTAVGLNLEDMRLMAGFYMNELLITLLHQGDPHPDLFAHYGAALVALSEDEAAEPVLRRFEISLLSEIGYGLITDRDIVNEQPLQPSMLYEYVADRGPVPLAKGASGALVLSGAELTAIGHGVFDEPKILGAAKRLLRAKLNWCLGGRPLKTRQVLASMQT